MSSTVPAHVRLANEIAVQFHGRPQDEATAAIATHIRMFWDPRMRTKLLAHIEGGGGADDLDPLAAAAIELLGRAGAAR